MDATRNATTGAAYRIIPLADTGPLKPTAGRRVIPTAPGPQSTLLVRLIELHAIALDIEHR
jgi:hypothetical protein